MARKTGHLTKLTNKICLNMHVIFHSFIIHNSWTLYSDLLVSNQQLQHYIVILHHSTLLMTHWNLLDIDFCIHNRMQQFSLSNYPTSAWAILMSRSIQSPWNTECKFMFTPKVWFWLQILLISDWIFFAAMLLCVTVLLLRILEYIIQ